MLASGLLNTMRRERPPTVTTKPSPSMRTSTGVWRAVPSLCISTATNSLADLDLVSRQLAAEPRRAREQPPFERGRERDQEVAIGCSTADGSKPCANSSAMKPVLKSPAAKRGCASSADWNARLLATPRIDEAVQRLAHASRSPPRGRCRRRSACRSSSRSGSRSRRPRRRRCRRGHPACRRVSDRPPAASSPAVGRRRAARCSAGNRAPDPRR